MKTNKGTFRQEGKKLIYTRTLDAPRDLVWEVWTTPAHLKEWWGPDGFSITNKSMEVAPGKYWEFTMHGWGRDFENRIQFIEVIEPSLLFYHHFGAEEEYDFKVTVTFEEMARRTLVTMTSVFKSEEILAELNREVKAIEGGNQTLNRMVAYAEALAENTAGY